MKSLKEIVEEVEQVTNNVITSQIYYVYLNVQ